MTDLYLGVDGGGTKTVARLLSETGGRFCVLGSGSAGGSNPYSVGWDRALGEVQRATAQACQGIGEMPTAAVLAIAGCASEGARDRFQKAASEAGIARAVEVVPDTAPLLADAAPGRPAIGVIAGTGSSALARNAAGETRPLGGWGYLIDDGGSGYALGRDALQAIAANADSDADGPQEPSADPFRQAVLAALGAASVAEIKPCVYQSDDPRGVIASLAPAVLRRAEQGDAPARTIVEHGAERLAELVRQARGWLGDGPSAPEVFLAGSLLQRSPYYRGLLIERLAEGAGGAASVRLAPDAACGCGRLAAERSRAV